MGQPGVALNNRENNRGDDLREAMELEEPVMDAPPVLGAGRERRVSVRAYNYWASLLAGREFPSVSDLNANDIASFRDASILLDFTNSTTDPMLRYIGKGLREESGLSTSEIKPGDVPGRSLLSRLTAHYLEILANRAPIGFEAEFVNTRGLLTFYRGILLPLSDDGKNINFIYGVMSWKEEASAAESADARAALEKSASRPIQNVEDIYDISRPVQSVPDAEPVDDVIALDVALPQDAAGDDDILDLDMPNLETADAEPVLDLDMPEDDTLELGIMDADPLTAAQGDDAPLDLAADMQEMTVGTSDSDESDMLDLDMLDPDMPETDMPGPDLLEPGIAGGPAVQYAEAVDLMPADILPDDTLPAFAAVDEEAVSRLADRLSMARDAAEQIKTADSRTRTALYDALAEALAFHADATADPASFAVLLDDAGLKMQDRAPFTPTVKMIFGIEYDKTRLTEYAAALSYAQRESVAPTDFRAYLDHFDGGLKGIVAAERQARAVAQGNRRVDRAADARVRLTHSDVLATLALANVPVTEDGYVLLVGRRNASGAIDVVAAAPPHKPTLDMVLRQVAKKQ